MLKYPLFVTCALLFGCAKTVDLGQESEKWKDSPAAGADPAEPQTIYEGSLRIVAFTVDDTDLYALLENVFANAHRVTLVACPVDRCQSERRTLFDYSDSSNTVLSATKLVLRKGRLFWLTGHQNPATGIASCSTLGCPGGPGTLLEDGDISGFASDGDFIYWTDGPQESVLRRASDGSGDTQSLYRWDGNSSIPEASEITEYADYLYLRGDAGIFRIRKDGSGAPEVITRDVNIGGVSVSEGGVYFTTRVLTGGVRHCPLSGCAGPADEVVSGQRWPNGIHADPNAVYWLTAWQGIHPVAKSGALVTAELPDGRGVRSLAQGLKFAQFIGDIGDWDAIFAVNQRAVYWQENDSYLENWLRRLPR